MQAALGILSIFLEKRPIDDDSRVFFDIESQVVHDGILRKLMFGPKGRETDALL